MGPDARKLLNDIRQAISYIESFTQTASFADYESNRMMSSAVERQFEIVGEATVRLFRVAPDTARRMTDHRRIIDFRNLIIHRYDTIDNRIVWSVAQERLPVLRREVEALLEEEWRETLMPSISVFKCP